MSRQNAFGRILLITAIVAIGTAAVWSMATFWAMETAQRAFRPQRPFETIYVTMAGEPALVRTRDGNTQNTEKILALDRQPLKVTSQELLHLWPLDAPGKSAFASRPDWQTRIAGINDGGVPPTYWYMVHDGEKPGRVYGIGFQASTRTVLGYFGRRGFTDALPPRDDWFKVPGERGMYEMVSFHGFGQEPRWATGQASFLLLADGKVWKIDLAKKQVSQMLDSPSGFCMGQVYRLLEAPLVAQEPSPYYSAQSMTPLDGMVREAESLVLINQRSGEHERYLLPELLREKRLSAVRLANGQLLLTAARDWRSEDYDVVWLNPSGEIAQQQTIRLESQHTPTSFAWVGWQSAVAGPLPLVNLPFSLVWGPQTAIDEGKAENFRDGLALMLSKTWPSMLAVFVVSAICAVLAYRRQLQYGLPHAGVWAAFAFLFGVPGWIAYRYHRTWPVLEECPACHQASPRDRERCVDCGAEFPGPGLKGIEVFA